MKLEGNYYTLMGIEQLGESTATYHIALLPDCDIYRGHFPGNPVCPGVCNMQTIKECAEKLTGKTLHVTNLKQCRLTAVATPTICPEVYVKVTAKPSEDTDTYTISASIYDTERSYMEYKGEMGNYIANNAANE